jgi:hypothetical protein
VVEVHPTLFASVGPRKAFGHVRTTEVDAAVESGARLLAEVFGDEARQAEVDEDRLAVPGAQHDVLGLDVHVHQAQPMHQGQALLEQSQIRGHREDAAAHFHGKLDAVAVHEYVEAEVRLYFGSDLCEGGDFEYEPLFDGVGPHLSLIDFYTFDSEGAVENDCFVGDTKFSFSNIMSMFDVLSDDVEDVNIH